jgi:hypothetical protein
MYGGTLLARSSQKSKKVVFDIKPQFSPNQRISQRTYPEPAVHFQCFQENPKPGISSYFSLGTLLKNLKVKWVFDF